MNKNVLPLSVFFLGCVFGVSACKKETQIGIEDKSIASEELNNVELVTTLTNPDHKIELYSESGKLYSGYNQMYLQIKNSDGSTIANATVSWGPIIYMASMNYSCPVSEISVMPGSLSVYSDYIVFQMARNDSEYWELNIKYTINGIDYSARKRITVINSSKCQIESFQGIDGSRYILALVELAQQNVSINDMKVLLYRMESMMNFIITDICKIKIDPRMPGMANHSSPGKIMLTLNKEIINVLWES